MKFKIYLEYAGANYSGWQKQPNETKVKTVQGTLIKAIEAVFKKNKGLNKFIDLQGSGRTDAGVHAIEQAAHLESETMLAPEILKIKINDELPSDINILEIEKAAKSFHARHDAKSRQYLYVISKRRTAFEKRYVWWIKDRLDVKKMKQAAELFVGMHDFKNFSEKSPEDKSTKCLVESLEITDDQMKIYIRIKASHFLWKMVRRIVGTLAEAGRGNITPNEIALLLSEKSSVKFNPAEYTAPPSGLFLEKVEY
jgi:tRNA pseudouridine38-40 synthase